MGMGRGGGSACLARFLVTSDSRAEFVTFPAFHVDSFGVGLLLPVPPRARPPALPSRSLSLFPVSPCAAVALAASVGRRRLAVSSCAVCRVSPPAVPRAEVMPARLLVVLVSITFRPSLSRFPLLLSPCVVGVPLFVGVASLMIRRSSSLEQRPLTMIPAGLVLMSSWSTPRGVVSLFWRRLPSARGA